MVRALVSQLKWSRVLVPVVPRSGNNSGQVPLSPSSYRLNRAVMPGGWEGNHGVAHWPCVTDFSGLMEWR